MKRKGPDGLTLIVAAAMVLAVVYCLGLAAYACRSDAGAQAAQRVQTGVDTSYAERLFDNTRVHTIELTMAPGDWQRLKDRAFYKEYADCTVAVDGEVLHHVGVRTKGNSTLLKSLLAGTDKLSLHLDFGGFNQGQRYHGLDVLSLYNNNCDASFLRNYVCFDMMRAAGVPSSLCSFAAVYLNGEYLGLYTAFEGVREAFAVRNFGTRHGQLYKPEHMDLAAMLTGGAEMSFLRALADVDLADLAHMDVSSVMGAEEDVVALQYVGPRLADYDQIWDASVFDVGRSDKTRLVQAIRSIGQGDTAQAADGEELARYFAVNAFVLNTDAYNTSMAHNYFLYEKDGRIALLPWDYDMSLGSTGTAFGEVSMTEFLNLPIDTPVIGTSLEARPLLHALLRDEAWLGMYHAELRRQVEDYVGSGAAAQRITAAAEMIRPWVEAELGEDGMPGHESCVRSALEFMELRARSIAGQLDGTIPATAAGQQAAPHALVDASAFTLPSDGSFLAQVESLAGSDLGEGLVRMVRQVNFASLLLQLPLGEMAWPELSGLQAQLPGNAALPALDEGVLRRVLLALAECLAGQVLLPALSVILLLIALAVLYLGRGRRLPRAVKQKRKGGAACAADHH